MVLKRAISLLIITLTILSLIVIINTPTTKAETILQSLTDTGDLWYDLGTYTGIKASKLSIDNITVSENITLTRISLYMRRYTTPVGSDSIVRISLRHTNQNNATPSWYSIFSNDTINRYLRNFSTSYEWVDFPMQPYTLNTSEYYSIVMELLTPGDGLVPRGDGISSLDTSWWNETAWTNVGGPGWTYSHKLYGYYGNINTSYGTTDEEETTYTINGTILDNGDGNYTEAVTCGAWINTSNPVLEQYAVKNVTFAGTYLSNTTYSQAVSGLSPATYYYTKIWMQNSTGFYNETTQGTFLTKPYAPTTLTIVNSTAENITLSWSPASNGSNTNRTTVIVYKTTGYPSSPTDGTEGYNGTASQITIEGLQVQTTYYFSAWTYVNGSGSPYYWWFSDTYDTESGWQGRSSKMP